VAGPIHSVVLPPVGFIGLGVTRLAMARNLAAEAGRGVRLPLLLAGLVRELFQTRAGTW
jgi:hypothetical protein